MRSVRPLLHVVTYSSALLLTAGGCSRSEDTAAAKPASGSPAGTVGQSAEARVQQIYRGLCASCHGMDGAADGPAAASLKPPPRSFVNAQWQQSVTDEQIKAIIVQGGAALGKSPAMPPVPLLGQQPEQLDAMVRLVRSFGGDSTGGK